MMLVKQLQVATCCLNFCLVFDNTKWNLLLSSLARHQIHTENLSSCLSCFVRPGNFFLWEAFLDFFASHCSYESPF